MVSRKGRNRLRVAYVTPYAILPPNRGGRIRTHHLWRAMSAFAEVVPIVVGDNPGAGARAAARQAGAVFMPRRKYLPRLLLEALAAGRPITEPGLWEVLGVEGLPDALLRDLGAAPAVIRHAMNDRRAERIVERVRRTGADIVVLCDSTMGLLAPAMRTLGNVKVVVGPHNFDGGLYETMARTAPTDALRRWNAAASRAFAEAERTYAPHIDQLWVCSRVDLERFSSLVPHDKIRVVPNVYDVGPPTPVPDSRDLVFVGQGGYFPNEDAAHRLLAVSAALDARGVEHRVRIVGRAAASVVEAARRHPSVEVVGEVPSVAPFIETAAIVPITLTLGGGTRLKIVEAMAAGRPVLSTPVGIEGIEARNGVEAVIEPDLEAFPDRIVELFADRERAGRIARAGWELARESYSHQALLATVGACFEELAGVKRVADAAVFGRNLGADVGDEVATFNNATRLLVWTFEVRVAATFDALSGEFGAVGGADLPNAFVALRQRPNGHTLVEATAVLAPGIAPEAADVVLYAWGRPVLRRHPPAPVPRASAGMLALERDGDGLRVTGWSNAGAVTVDVRGGAGPVATLDVTPEPTGIFQCRVPASSGTSLSIATGDGFSERLSRPMDWLAQNLPSTARLGHLRDRYRGETAWIVGNGPSVRTEDLDALEGRLSFCFNRFHMAYDRMRFRPTYTVTGDKQMIEDFGQQIVDEAGGTVFVVHDRPPDLVGDYIWIRLLQVHPPLFSRTADHMVSPGGSSLYMAMQIGYLMGIRQFYLYGTDFKFAFEKARGPDNFRSAKGDDNHFISNYRGGKAWCPPSLKDIGAGFLTARRIIESEGGFLRNASRGGLMEMFERVPFEVAAQETRASRTDARA